LLIHLHYTGFQSREGDIRFEFLEIFKIYLNFWHFSILSDVQAFLNTLN
jgi:hypothetical protein